MEEEMEELHAEGLATHGDPESCVGLSAILWVGWWSVMLGRLPWLERIMSVE